jgi:hypothetical protein
LRYELKGEIEIERVAKLVFLIFKVFATGLWDPVSEDTVVELRWQQYLLWDLTDVLLYGVIQLEAT